MTQQLSVADLLVRCLEREGVTVVFGIPGEENLGLVDALARSPIWYVLVRHEQAASFMAEIYGRFTAAPGCARRPWARARSTCCSASQTPRRTVRR